MFWIKPPAALGMVFSDAWWRIPTDNPEVFLTFDDGPHPETTPFILDQLKDAGFTATFFCLGEAVEKYPHLFTRICEEGHGTGIHSYSHINGWKSSTVKYIQDIDKAAALIPSKLFRPPYGKLSWNQWKVLKTKYQIVMWSTSPEDYKTDLSTEVIYRRLTNGASAGDIVVLHENAKSELHIRHILPRYIKWLTKSGLQAKKLPDAD